MKTLKDFNVNNMQSIFSSLVRRNKINFLSSLSLENKRILVRCDFNVPLDEKGNILDDFKIRKSLPTIQYLIENDAKIILMSHLDDPSISPQVGEIRGLTQNLTQTYADPRLRLDKVKDKLEELLNINIKKTDDCVGQEVKNQISNLNPGEILLLENLRFHKEEKENDLMFAKELSHLGDIYINEAFSESHRAYASIVGVPQFLPHGAGFLLQKEIENLDKILKNPKRPLIIIIGGRKAENKAKFAQKLLALSDVILVGGLVKKELMKINVSSEKIIGPTGNLDDLDINNEIIELFREKILKAKTILWNGPLGKFEDENYKKGTLAIAKAIIESGAFSVVGGGETVEFLDRENLISKFNHISTGGGAMLAFLSGEKLPGLEALK